MDQKRPSRRAVVFRITRRGLLLRAGLAVALVAAVCVVAMIVKAPKRDVFGLGPRYVPSLLPVSLEGGWVSSEFGIRTDPIAGNRRMHEGIDLAVDEGVPVKAAASGRVVFAGGGGGYGNLVRIDHGNGIETRYAHNSVLKVSTRQLVTKGQVIALAGHTGRVKGNPGDHLHYEVRVKGKPINPRDYLPPFVEGGRGRTSGPPGP